MDTNENQQNQQEQMHVEGTAAHGVDISTKSDIVKICEATYASCQPVAPDYEFIDPKVGDSYVNIGVFSMSLFRLVENLDKKYQRQVRMLRLWITRAKKTQVCRIKIRSRVVRMRQKKQREQASRLAHNQDADAAYGLDDMTQGGGAVPNIADPYNASAWL